MAVSTLLSVNILKIRFESSQRHDPIQMLITKLRVRLAIKNLIHPGIIQNKKYVQYGRNPVHLHLPFANFPITSVAAKYLHLFLQIPTILEMRPTGYCDIIASFGLV